MIFPYEYECICVSGSIIVTITITLCGILGNNDMPLCQTFFRYVVNLLI